MRTSNIVITVVLAAASLFLLWLWYYLGLNVVDQPLDLVISIVWWAIVAAGVVAVVRLEKARRYRIRTVYVASDRLFNGEAGTLAAPADGRVADAVAGILGGLRYDFSRAKTPEDPAQAGSDAAAPAASNAPAAGGTAPRFDYVVRTAAYKPASDDEKETWEGEVVAVATGETRPFASREELAAIIG